MHDLTEGNLYKNFLVFAIPMVLAGVLSQSYAIIDTVIAGKLLGDGALAAIGATSPLLTFIESIFWGIAGGLGIRVANLFGAKRYDALKETVISCGLFTAALIFAVSVLLVLFQKPIFGLLHVDFAILRETGIYYSVVMLGNVFVIFNVIFLHTINALGDGGFPFYMSLLAAGINLTGNIFSVTVLHMGIFGLALSTVLSSLVVDICYILKLKKDFRLLTDSRPKTAFSLRTVKETYVFSLPIVIQQSVMYFSSLVLSPIVNGIGSAASASYTVALRVYNFNAAVYQNSAKTIGNYVAQCYGAKKFDQLNKGLWVGILQGICFLLPVVLVCALLPDTVCSLFFKSGADSVAYGYSVTFLQVYMPFVFANLLANAFHNYFRGVNRMKPLILATLCGSVMRIILTLILVPHWGMNGVFAGWVSAWFFDGIFGFVLYRINNSRQDSSRKRTRKIRS